MIDLHTHTDQSDGTVSPTALVELALDLRLEALAITDHDTLAGYDGAVDAARSAGIELLCGIELSTKLTGTGRSVHLLGYFFDQPTIAFREWLEVLQQGRRDRNLLLIARLKELGLDVELPEVQALGKNLTGRPHFATVLLHKGYVSTLQEAFDKYLGEDGSAYVDRDEPDLTEGIRRIHQGGGLPSLAHPMRISRNPEQLEKLIAELAADGRLAVEAYHSEHTPEDSALLVSIARRHHLPVSGGSDFHGANKPGISLGTGRNNLALPLHLLDNMRRL